MPKTFLKFNNNLLFWIVISLKYLRNYFPRPCSGNPDCVGSETDGNERFILIERKRRIFKRFVLPNLAELNIFAYHDKTQDQSLLTLHY